MLTDAQTDESTLLTLGSLVPAFKCTLIGGKTIDISNSRGNVVMINFFATWCPPCNLELPALQNNIWNRYKDEDEFILIVAGRDHNERLIADFAAEKGYDMPFIADPNRDIFNLFASQYIPRNIIIDRDGKVIFQNRGYNDKEFKMIEQILSGELGQNKTIKTANL